MKNSTDTDILELLNREHGKTVNLAAEEIRWLREKVKGLEGAMGRRNLVLSKIYRALADDWFVNE